MAATQSPLSTSKRRAAVALFLGIAGVIAMPAAVLVAEHVSGIAILDAAYAVPLAFVLGLLAAGIGRRAKRNLNWLRLHEGGTGIASAAVTLGILAIALALTGALSVGLYEGVRYYQRHH